MMKIKIAEIIMKSNNLSSTNPANPNILKILIQTMWIIFLILLTTTLHALTPVIIDENIESVSLGKYMEILEYSFSINLLKPLRGLYVY